MVQVDSYISYYLAKKYLEWDPHNLDIYDRITEMGIKFPPDPVLSIVLVVRIVLTIQ